MSLIFDLLIIIAVAITVILGVRRGFVKSVSLLLSVAVSLVAVFVFAPSAAKLISENLISDELSASVTNTVGAWIPKELAKPEEIGDWLAENINSNESLTSALTNIGIDGEDITEALDAASAAVTDTESAVSGAIEGYDREAFLGFLAKDIANGKANALSTAIAGIVIFIIAMILMSLVMKIVNKIVKLPVLNSLNKLLGLVFGIICAAAVALVLANLAINFMEPLAAYNSKLFNDSVIEGSFILNFVKVNGLIFF